MLAKTGLLIVSNPKHIGKILPSIQKKVKNTLYIQLLAALGDPLGSFHRKIFIGWPKLSKTIFHIYSQAAMHCYNLDVRVLLSGIKYNIPKIQTQKPIDMVIFDKRYDQGDTESFIKTKIENFAEGYSILMMDTGYLEITDVDNGDESVGTHAVLGGTFDRLHLAHKLLLSEAALRSSEVVTVGITEENMLQSKILWELIEDMDVRVKNVEEFLKDICRELKYNIVPISDPYGPAIQDPSMKLIIVSKETIKGGDKINEIRKEKKLKPLEIIPVNLIDEPNPHSIEEAKISSSTARIRLLGTVLKPIEPNNDIPKKPYVIGLTGGIASGKSGVAKWLEKLNVQIIYCDTVAHDLYKPNMPCYKLVVEHFGNGILAANGEIDRKALGGIVFGNPDQLNKLNSLVWPAIAEEVNNMIKNTEKEVVVIEAAVLLIAGWEKNCHEVWTTLVPREEAIKRLVTRNGLTKEEATKRLDSQPPNTYYVKNANIVFCPFWAPEYTKEQVDRAWQLLQERLPLI